MVMFSWDNPELAAVYRRKANRTKPAKGATDLLSPEKVNNKV